MELFLGIWQGDHARRFGVWLRWWDSEENLLLWGDELATMQRQIAEEERQKAEQEKQKAERLLAQLRAAGIELENM